MKLIKLSAITSAMLAALLSTAAIAGHHETKITTGFSPLDKDGDGFIVQTEAKGAIESETLTMMDSDGDEMVSRAEFSAFVDEKPSLFSDAIIAKVKAKGTTDAVLVNKGTVGLVDGTDGEMISEKNKELRTEMSATADEKFTEIDINNDGELTSEELDIAKVEGDFTAMDENDDKVITRMEYRAYFEEIESE
ncbi:hypothetical protein D210916BOD24_25860 [Alteromonas sp. D210916BOD_24]|uniref:hypothetical protein n=1 Tax=Alteromonas sp. D210916BOD_24 TaxID=3157618 RepID=UPI00399CE5A5